MQAHTLGLLRARPFAFPLRLLPHRGTVPGYLLFPSHSLLGGTHAQREHDGKQCRRNQCEQCAEVECDRAHQHHHRDRGKAGHDNPPSADRGTTKSTHPSNPFLGVSALMRLIGLHYCPFRLHDGFVGKPRSAIGINQMKRWRKAILTMLDHLLHAFDGSSRQPNHHKNHDDRKHYYRA